MVATFEDFDESLEKRQRGPGSGRKHACQALVRYLSTQPEQKIRRLELVILDWKTLPKQGPLEMKVSLHRGETDILGLWGSREQLAGKLQGSIWDLVVCTQTKRMALDFAAQVKARAHVAMLHGYDLPFGPWGQEQTAAQLEEHAALCHSFELFTASQHLAASVGRWSGGRCHARCCYAADYGFFEPVPAALRPWEATSGYVTMVSPCPEKGLCILLKLAQMMPETKFLAVRTGAWTKAWHEQALKKLPNVTVRAAAEAVDEFFRGTRVLLAPSLFQEAFGLCVLEAQLRGIPVVSTGTCGLAEANRVPSTVVNSIPLVYDQRTRELVVGMTMEEAELALAEDRAGAVSMEQWRQAAATQESTNRVADDAEVAGVVAILRPLLDSESALKEASEEARLAATAFVEGRHGRCLEALEALLYERGDVKPAPALVTTQAAGFRPPNRALQVEQAPDEDNDPDFNPDHDFAAVADFDGAALSARVLVRFCEQGNLALASELLQARADVNAGEAQCGVTPLIGAANAGQLELVKYLIRKDADVNLEVSDGTQRTALHAASQRGHVAVVQQLLESKASVRAEDLTKTTPLHLAVKGGHAGATELLLRAKANPNQADDQGHVAINDAVAKDRFDLATKLLEHGALVNVRNMSGLEAISFSRTPQMQAIIMKNDINF